MSSTSAFHLTFIKEEINMYEDFDPNAPYEDRVKAHLEMAGRILDDFRRNYEINKSKGLPSPLMCLGLLATNDKYKRDFRQALVEVIKENLSNPDAKEAAEAEKVLIDLGVINSVGKQN